MCTITFIPHAQGVVIASNRDEQTLRSIAKMPEIYHINGGNIVFPKDGKAGGTWIAMHENGHVMVLMNGAYERHVMRNNYRKSRGLIFLDIFSDANPLQQFEQINLDNIEPFTLILWADGQLWDLRWDGQLKHKTQVDETTTHIWSSASLYTKEVRTEREEWFKDWQVHTDMQHISVDDIRAFHTFGGNKSDEENSLVMHRGNFLQTISITTIDWKPGSIVMQYRDLVQDATAIVPLAIKR